MCHNDVPSRGRIASLHHSKSPSPSRTYRREVLELSKAALDGDDIRLLAATLARHASLTRVDLSDSRLGPREVLLHLHLHYITLASTVALTLTLPSTLALVLTFTLTRGSRGRII